MIQIHDEIAMSVKSVDEANEIAKVMEKRSPLKYPVSAMSRDRPSWGEAK